MGNPGAFSYSHTLWVKGFLDGLGSPHYYSAGSQDVNNRFAASALLYGSPLLVPIPDLNRAPTSCFMVGANPLVSHGSVLSAPRVREQLNAIVDRGGRVVVVDPRRTETARQYEHVPIRPDADAWLLLSMLHVIFAEGLADRAVARALTRRRGDALRERVRGLPPERTEEVTGVPAGHACASSRARSRRRPSAAAYGRTGSCLGRFGTLVAYLLDALNAVTGNLDRPGRRGLRPPADRARRDRREGGPRHLRQGALALRRLPRRDRQPARDADPEGDHDAGQAPDPRLLRVGRQPGAVGPGRRRARARASSELDLMVSLDFYVSDTSRHADYVLPATTFLEREDVPVAFLGFFSTPFMQVTEAVVPPRGRGAPGVAHDRRPLAADRGRAVLAASRCARSRKARAAASRPRRLIDAVLRIGPGRRLVRPAALRPVAEEGRALAARHRARRPHRDRTCSQDRMRHSRPAGARSATPRSRSARSTGWSPSNGARAEFPAAA